MSTSVRRYDTIALGLLKKEEKNAKSRFFLLRAVRCRRVECPPGQLSPRTADPKCGGSPPRVGGPPSYACVQGTITLSHTFPTVVENNMEPLINRRRLR